MSKKYYQETLDIKGKLFWVGCVLFIFLISALGFFSKSERLYESTSLYGIGMEIALLALLIFVIIRIRLKTKITSKGISVKFSPFFNSKLKIPHTEVASYRVEEITPRSLRLRRNIDQWFEKKFTLTGRNGISITTVDGKSYFIGSANPKALKKALERAHGNID